MSGKDVVGFRTSPLSRSRVLRRPPSLRRRRAARRTAHVLRLRLHLTLRETEGFARSLCHLLEIEFEVPDHTTLSRRLRQLDVPLATNSGDRPIQLVLDSTGLSIFGEREWARAKNGERGKRGWRKLHLGVSDSDETLARVVTDASVTTDGAHDTQKIYDAARHRNATVIVPPIASAVPDDRTRPRSPERDATVRSVAAVGRRAWKRASGDHRQGTVENAFFRYTTIVGPALRARDEDSRRMEARPGRVLLNRMRDLAWPESVVISA